MVWIENLKSRVSKPAELAPSSVQEVLVPYAVEMRVFSSPSLMTPSACPTHPLKYPCERPRLAARALIRILSLPIDIYKRCCHFCGGY